MSLLVSYTGENTFEPDNKDKQFPFLQCLYRFLFVKMACPYDLTKHILQNVDAVSDKLSSLHNTEFIYLLYFAHTLF